MNKWFAGAVAVITVTIASQVRQCIRGTWAKYPTSALASLAIGIACPNDSAGRQGRGPFIADGLNAAEMVEINGLRSVQYRTVRDPCSRSATRAGKARMHGRKDSPPRHTYGDVVQQIDLVMRVRSAV